LNLQIENSRMGHVISSIIAAALV